MSIANVITRGIGPGSNIANLITAGLASAAAPVTYQCGVYYFPGWSTPGGGPFASDPWSVIPADRVPLYLGKFDETQQSVVDVELGWYAQFGITFLAIDWFMQWSGTTLQPFLDHFVTRYLSSVVTKPKFCVQFANQTNAGGLTPSTWTSIYNYWISNYFPDSNYYKIGGKPVVIMNSVPSFHDSMGTHVAVKAALDAARAAAVTAGFPGILFMGGQADSSSAWTDASTPAVEGWDGITGSNIYTTTKVSDNSAGASPLVFTDLDNAVFSGLVGGYRGFCYGWLNAAGINLFWPPLTAGFDETPWNPSTTLHGMPSSTEWGNHLTNAKTLLDANTTATQLTFMVEAATEFGEGSILDPTSGNGGFDRLRQLNQKFALPTILAFSIPPTAPTVGSNTAVIQFYPSGGEPITYRVVAVPHGATAPTAAEVLAGTASGGGTASYASNSLTCNMGDAINVTGTGLSASTSYDFYAAISSGASTLRSSAVQVTTTAATSSRGLVRKLVNPLVKPLGKVLGNR